MLSSASAVYSSGPVTPSMRNRPCRSWWPSERHSRAVSTSSSSAASRSNSRRRWPHVARDRVGDVGVDVEGGGAGRPVAGALLPRRSSATGTPHPASPSWAARCLGQVQGGVPPAQRVRGRVGLGVRSAPAARTSRCPRTRGRRSRGRSGPWPGSPAARPRAPACSTWNSAKRTACCSSGSPSISTSASSQNSSR